MDWQLGAFSNGIIMISYALIAAVIFGGIVRSKAWGNTLAIATGVIFASCAVGHGVHAYHLFAPSLGFDVDTGLAMRRGFSDHLVYADVVTAAAGVFYWTLRGRLGGLIDSGAMYVDLEKERARADALHQSERNYRFLYDTTPLLLWNTDVAGRTQRFNQRWYDYTGLTPEQSLNDRWIDTVHPEDRERSGVAWTQAVEKGTPYSIEYRLRRADGTYRWFLGAGLPMRDESGAITQWSGSCTDIDAQKSAYEVEKQIADTLQRAFIQQTLPEVPNLGLHATYVPAQQEARVGGDWYDVIRLSNGRLFFSIGDVAGHGLSAAIGMNRVRQAMVAAAVSIDDPAAVLRTVNRVLIAQSAAMVTAICGFVEADVATVSYACAGHPPPLLVAPDGSSEFFSYGAQPLGISEDFAVETITFKPPKGGLIVLYTDGVIEAERDLDRGQQRLIEAAHRAVVEGVEDPAASIRQSIFESSKPFDDIALLTLAFRGDDLKLNAGLADTSGATRIAPTTSGVVAPR